MADSKRIRRQREYEREMAEKKRRGSIYTPIVPGSYHGPVFVRDYGGGDAVEIDFQAPAPQTQGGRAHYARAQRPAS